MSQKARAQKIVWSMGGANGVAITMTADAARKTGNSLISAADIAKRQAYNKALHIKLTVKLVLQPDW
ncbi:hypothetical protein [Sphingobium yanoikuyae]|uniref:hypothetical protein n=1 Tax=Sphingobium yanoikuyae TaxID=13690 RepID=UPI0028A99E71|nr:hypothetical protein [Sphingobium yanoikuyae]